MRCSYWSVFLGFGVVPLRFTAGLLLLLDPSWISVVVDFSEQFWRLGSSCIELGGVPVFLVSSATIPNLKIPGACVGHLSVVLMFLEAGVFCPVSDKGLNFLVLIVFVLHFLEGLTSFRLAKL